MSAAIKPKRDPLSLGWDRWPAHDYDQLPFVDPGGSDGRIFWAPRVKGDYGFDNTLGYQYARAALVGRHDKLTLWRHEEVTPFNTGRRLD